MDGTGWMHEVTSGVYTGAGLEFPRVARYSNPSHFSDKRGPTEGKSLGLDGVPAASREGVNVVWNLHASSTSVKGKYG